MPALHFHGVTQKRTVSLFRYERNSSAMALHQVDTAHFLFGEIDSVYAQASRRNSNIVAEDQAIIVVSHESGVHGWVDGHRFLEPNPRGPAMGDATFEGEDGTISVLATGDIYHNNVRVWTRPVEGTLYGGDCVRTTQVHFISCLKDGSPFESAGRSYLRTCAAVEAAYRSATERHCIRLAEICEP